MSIIKSLILLVLFSIGLVRFHSHNTSNIHPDEANVKTLLQTELAKELMPDREVKIDLVEIPPNTTLERHWHPGEEFHYYLEGEVEIKIDGEKSIIGKPGTVGHVPYKKWHTAIAGPEGAKILVFRVHTKGKPWRYIK